MVFVEAAKWLHSKAHPIHPELAGGGISFAPRDCIQNPAGPRLRKILDSMVSSARPQVLHPTKMDSVWSALSCCVAAASLRERGWHFAAGLTALWSMIQLRRAPCYRLFPSQVAHVSRQHRKSRRFDERWLPNPKLPQFAYGKQLPLSSTSRQVSRKRYYSSGSYVK